MKTSKNVSGLISKLLPLIVLLSLTQQMIVTSADTDDETTTTETTGTTELEDSDSETTTPTTPTNELEYSGSCAFKGWAAVAVCRKDFVDRLEGQKRTKEEECCLYRILERCSFNHARKLCANATEIVVDKHLEKYRKMMKASSDDCVDIVVDSFACFWISWENYVSCFIFLIFTLIIDIYIVFWYIRQTDIDRSSDKQSLVSKTNANAV